MAIRIATGADDDMPHDPALRSVILAIAGLAPPRRNALIRFLEFTLSLPATDVATLIKIICPELQDELVAQTVGVSAKTLQRSEVYQRAKAKLSDYAHIQRKPTRRRANRRGGFCPLVGQDA